MATQHSNNYKDKLLRGQIDFSTHVIKAMLMAQGFTYNPALHNKKSDITAYELASGFGYTTGGATLANVAITRDDINNKVRVSWNSVSWTAAGGDIGPVVGVMLYDDTQADDCLIGFMDFGVSKTTIDGGVFAVSNIVVDAL